MKVYMPGSHIIATLESSQLPLLRAFSAFKDAVNEFIEASDLQKLGERRYGFHHFKRGQSWYTLYGIDLDLW